MYAYTCMCTCVHTEHDFFYFYEIHIKPAILYCAIISCFKNCIFFSHMTKFKVTNTNSSVSFHPTLHHIYLSIPVI